MKKPDKTFFIDVAKAVLFSILFSFAAVLTLAVIVRFSNVSEKGVVILNTVAKILAIIFGVLVGFKTKSGGLIKGITAGVLYVLLAFLIFAFFEKFDGVKFNYFDLLFGVLAGAFSGIIKVNIKQKN